MVRPRFARFNLRSAIVTVALFAVPVPALGMVSSVPGVTAHRLGSAHSSQAGRIAVTNLQDAIPHGFTQGMALVGAMLPAVGFAMLLRIMPVRRYWYMLPIGFVLFAYLQVPLQGIACSNGT